VRLGLVLVAWIQLVDSQAHSINLSFLFSFSFYFCMFPSCFDYVWFVVLLDIV